MADDGPGRVLSKDTGILISNGSDDYMINY